jgi:hypothetical protein
MTIKRAAAYGVLSVLVLAWLSAAASISRQTPPTSDEPRQPVQTAGTETLAADVQAQAERLNSGSPPRPRLRNHPETLHVQRCGRRSVSGAHGIRLTSLLRLHRSRWSRRSS